MFLKYKSDIIMMNIPQTPLRVAPHAAAPPLNPALGSPALRLYYFNVLR